MKYIKTPNGEFYPLSECELLDIDIEIDISKEIENQKKLANELFLDTGILVG